ncbi:MAG: RNA polymerase sigma factor (sigma-70 family) [Polaribacter sp.]
MKKYSQQEIIAGCKKQDPRFQRALVEQYSDQLMGISMRYTRDQSSAKDILQEGLVKILNSFSTYEEQGYFVAWMKRIVIRTALNYFDKGCFKNELYTISDQPEKSVDPSIYSDLATGELMNIINRLPDSYKTVFNLRVIEGYSHKEIAEILGIQESTSRSKLARAREILQKFLCKSEVRRLKQQRKINL